VFLISGNRFGPTNQETRQGKSWSTKAARNINERISSYPNQSIIRDPYYPFIVFVVPA
jgi:hypothetical protein